MNDQQRLARLERIVEQDHRTLELILRLTLALLESVSDMGNKAAAELSMGPVVRELREVGECQEAK